jgi:hypothetical protein
VNNAIKSNTPQSIVKLDGSLSDYIDVIPSENDINNLANIVSYKDELNNGCKVFWFAIERTENAIPTVYGVLYPSSYEKVLINISDNIDNQYFIPIENNKINLDYDNVLSNLYIDGVEYTKEQIENGEFIVENRNVYFIKN